MTMAKQSWSDVQRHRQAGIVSNEISAISLSGQFKQVAGFVNVSGMLTTDAES